MIKNICHFFVKLKWHTVDIKEKLQYYFPIASFKIYLLLYLWYFLDLISITAVTCVYYFHIVINVYIKVASILYTLKSVHFVLLVSIPRQTWFL